MIPKFNFNQRITETAINRAKDVLSLQGMALPCSVVAVSGSIVTVKFEIISGFTIPNVTIPHFGGEWIRYPVQVGDKGVVVPMDARLNAVTGIGEGFADLSKPANLTSLVFMPVANVAWSAVNGDYLTLYGQTGVTIKDSRTGTKLITVNASGITINGNVTITGTVTANGKIIDDTHKHSGVQAGGSQTGTVV
jgi:hypothetical protein